MKVVDVPVDPNARQDRLLKILPMKRRYKTGLVVTKAEMRDLALHSHAFHGDWNYELRPRPT